MSKINKITHKEIMLLFGYVVDGAEQRITTTRNSSQKNTIQTLTVVEYCKYEGITLDDFYTLAKRAFEKL